MLHTAATIVFLLLNLAVPLPVAIGGFALAFQNLHQSEPDEAFAENAFNTGVDASIVFLIGMLAWTIVLWNGYVLILILVLLVAVTCTLAYLGLRHGSQPATDRDMPFSKQALQLAYWMIIPDIVFGVCVLIKLIAYIR
jgi:hypothetical protein